MSIISHLVIWVVLLSSLFLHGSSARCFGLINNQPATRLHLLSKQMMTEDQKLEHDRASTPLLPEERTSREVVRDSKHEGHGERARKEADHHLHDNNTMNKNGEKDGAVSAVTWKVREKKRGEPQAEFNLDYLPARTHPPVHN